MAGEIGRATGESVWVTGETGWLAGETGCVTGLLAFLARTHIGDGMFDPFHRCSIVRIVFFVSMNIGKVSCLYHRYFSHNLISLLFMQYDSTFWNATNSLSVHLSTITLAQLFNCPNVRHKFDFSSPPFIEFFCSCSINKYFCSIISHRHSSRTLKQISSLRWQCCPSWDKNCTDLGGGCTLDCREKIGNPGKRMYWRLRWNSWEAKRSAQIPS